MEIKEKVLREVDEIIGYKCDICGEELKVFFESLDLNTIEYDILCGGYGERSETIVKHFCSADCLKQALKQTSFGAKIKISQELVDELIKQQRGDIMEYKGFKIEVEKIHEGGYSMCIYRISDNWILTDEWNPSIRTIS